jgi:hypothetical protein
MSQNPSSPRVTAISWGSVAVEGISQQFKDVKLYPGGAREWDWNETGTRHVPGIKPADVQELIDNGARVIVLSVGMEGALQVMPETIAHLESNDVTHHVLRTDEAVNLYNQFADSVQVGALIHSTC